MMLTALCGARIFDGERFAKGHAILISGRHIRHVLPISEIPDSAKRVELDGGLIAPGFIDVQVNGGGGALLNHNPAADVVHTIAQSHRRFGTTGMLPTVITDAPPVTVAAIEAVRRAREEGAASVLGIHIEGPFLDPRRKGAHAENFIRSIRNEDVAWLAQAGCGSVMLTLAPNMVSPHMISRLVEVGVRVSLGHSDASFIEVQAALDAGATSFTHLFNAMSQMTGREPGMVGAALAHRDSYIGIIADGFHMHDVSLKLALASTRQDRFMLVSDAMPPAAGGPDVFTLQGRKVTRVSGRLQLEDGTLAGSNLTMDEAVRYCVNTLGVALPTALQMASRNPACFMGRNDLGCIRAGALASLVHLDDNLTVKATWVEGS